MAYYRPRMAARLSVPVWGSSQERIEQEDGSGLVEFNVRVRRSEISRNDHNHADSSEVTVDWLDAGVDPRLLSNAIVEVYIGNADESGQWDMPREDRRFIGIATDVERESDESNRSVRIQALDFTALFIESKPYPEEGVPNYGMTLEDAWKLICQHAGGKDTSGQWFKSAEFLADKLTPRGVDSWPPSFSKVAPPRLKTALAKTPIPIKKGADAWAIWQQCCGMFGLISWIYQDSVIVTTATNYYTRSNPPRFVWGKNILSLRERRNCSLSGKKVALVSYDPLTGELVQVWYPPRGEEGKKKGKASKRGGKADDYDVFEYNGITDEAALQSICQRVYEERSRQELEGTIVTSEMFIDGLDGRSADLLKLGSGQDVRIEVEQETMDGLKGIDSIADRVAYLEARGYRRTMAQLLAKNQEALSLLSAVFHTRGVRTTLETDEKGGSFEIEIQYCNRIQVTGDAR